MKAQKVIFIYGDLIGSELTINKTLNDGWTIVSVTAQNVATGKGAFLVVFEREK